jgi:hypothetical protein
MNMQRIFHITSLLVLSFIAMFSCTGATQSQQLADPVLRSTHHLGDTLQLLPNEEGYDSHLLVFFDVTTCFTCIDMLHTFSILEKQYHLSITMVMEGQMQEYADSQKNKSGWSFTMIGDPLHLYEKDYEVIAPPFYYLTGRNGKILGMDKLAGVNFSVETLQSLIESAEKSNSYEQTSLPTIKQFTLSNSDGSPIIIGATNFVISFIHSSRIAILDGSLLKLYIADSQGRVCQKFDLGSIFTTAVGISWYIPDRQLLVRLPSFTTNCMPYSIDISSGKIRAVNYDQNSIPAGCRMPYAWINPISGIIYGDILPKQSLVAVDSNQPTVIEFDSTGRFLNLFGKPEKTLTKYIVSLVAQAHFGFDYRGWLYEYESLSNAVNVYGSDGNLIRHIPLNFGPKWKPYTTNIPSVQDMPFWIKLNSNTSWGEEVLTIPDDSESAVAYISYLNGKYKQGDLDPHSTDVILTYFLHRINSDFSQGDDIELPENTVPASVGKNYCLASQYQGNHLKLIWYALNN